MPIRLLSILVVVGIALIVMTLRLTRATKRPIWSDWLWWLTLATVVGTAITTWNGYEPVGPLSVSILDFAIEYLIALTGWLFLFAFLPSFFRRKPATPPPEEPQAATGAVSVD